MKKIITLFVTLAVLSSAIFGETIGKRWFELKTDVPVYAGNNAIGVFDVLQEEVVIDLEKIANDLPEKGFVTILNTNPSFAVTLNILDVKAGIEAGVDVNGNIGLSKSLFEFIGTGNELNQDLVFGGGGNADVFAYTSFPVSFKIKKIEINVVPSLFTPVLHSEVSDTKCVVKNTEDGTISIDGTYNVLIQSCQSSATMNSDSKVNPNELLANVGADLRAGVKVPVLDKLKVTGNIAMPVVPGHLNSRMAANGTVSYAVNVLDSSKNKDFSYGMSEFTTTDDSSIIHRPMEMMGGVEWKPCQDFVTLKGSLGFGVRYPFTQSAYCFAQYNASATVQLKRILGLTFSTQYMNEVFKHEADLMFNVRLFELDTGVSLVGPDIKSSLSGKGFGAHVTFCFGF